MVKRLTKHEGGWALVIDQAMLELLKIGPETPLEVTTDGTSLMIAPAGTEDAGNDEALKQALKDVNAQYGEVLKNLAK